MAVAFFHFTPEMFYEMRIGQFMDAMACYNNQRLTDQRFNAEIIRMQTTTMINIQLKKKDRIKPDQLWTFPWEEDEKEEITSEDIQKMHEEVLKKFNR